jgi:uncharacterized SAM-binding protein YcdF (DUF218 family)
MAPAPRDPSPLDRDALFTFALTLLVSLLTLGIANLFALYRVLAAARLRTDPGSASPLLLVPGKRLIGERPDCDFALRLRRAAALSAQDPGHLILILGGITGEAQVSEAAAGARYLRALPNGGALHIELESASRDTLTNLRNVRELLARRPGGPPATLISNRYHLARIGLIADSLRIGHRLWPAEERFAPDAALWPVLLRESFFYLWFLVGKGWARLTRNARMLGRVT